MFQQYLERLHRRQAKPSTLNNFNRTIALFQESGLDPLKAEDWQIEEWLGLLGRERCLAPRTIRLHLENLSAAYNYAVHRRIIQAAPTETVRLPREPDREPRILSHDELRYMLGNCMTDQQHLLLCILMFTGMRRNEVRCLKWEDISPDSIKVIGKGGKLRHIPLHPALQEVIVRWREEPTSPYCFPGRGGALRHQRSLAVVLDQARGKVLCSFHDFRRTVATSLADNGVQEGIIDRIMGWAPRTVRERYYVRRADESMQAGILALYANDPIRVL